MSQAATSNWSNYHRPDRPIRLLAAMRKRDEGIQPSTESAYYCSADWHLIKKKSYIAIALYHFALQISRKNDRQFFCSQASLAAHFGCSERHIRRAIKTLRETDDKKADQGFFRLIGAKKYEVSRYKVLDHKEWAAQHPGKCTIKIRMPWSGQGDQLGRQLYAASGGRIAFLHYQVTMIRKLGLTEPLIIDEWRRFLLELTFRNNRKGKKKVVGLFIRHLEGSVCQ